MLRVVQVVRQQRCNGHCLSDCPAQQLKQQLRSAQVAGQWRGDTALTLPLFWRRSTVSPVFFGRFPRSSLSLSRPLPTLSPSLIGQLASVDVKQHKTGSVQIVQELCESRGGRPGLSVLTSLLVSVDIKDLLKRASALVTTCP